MEISRHDIPQEIKDLLIVAIDACKLDAFSIYELATEHRDDWHALADDLCEIAFASIHVDVSIHRRVVVAAEKYWATKPIEPETTPTIADFAILVEDHQRAAYLKRFPLTGTELVDHACAVTTKHGRKYTKVDVGRSGKYMVVNETGEIFGIKAYGVIHRGHAYGTLETIDDWQWGAYTAYPAA